MYLLSMIRKRDIAMLVLGAMVLAISIMVKQAMTPEIVKSDGFCETANLDLRYNADYTPPTLEEVQKVTYRLSNFPDDSASEHAREIALQRFALPSMATFQELINEAMTNGNLLSFINNMKNDLARKGFSERHQEQLKQIAHIFLGLPGEAQPLEQQLAAFYPRVLAMHEILAQQLRCYNLKKLEKINDPSGVLHLNARVGEKEVFFESEYPTIPLEAEEFRCFYLSNEIGRVVTYNSVPIESYFPEGAEESTWRPEDPKPLWEQLREKIQQAG